MVFSHVLHLYRQNEGGFFRKISGLFAHSGVFHLLRIVFSQMNGQMSRQNSPKHQLPDQEKNGNTPSKKARHSIQSAEQKVEPQEEIKYVKQEPLSEEEQRARKREKLLENLKVCFGAFSIVMCLYVDVNEQCKSTYYQADMGNC